MKSGKVKPHLAEVLLTSEISRFLKEKEFLNIATCDFEHNPNVAPKFLLKIEKDTIYLADYILGRTWRNIKINPKVSLSTVNFDTLMGYQINGFAELIDKGGEYKLLSREVSRRAVHFSVKRIIQAVQSEKKSERHEVSFPEKIAFIKIMVQEIVEIAPSGKLERRASRFKP